jgi:murein L,D-transpeptidase YcbB/YkuD
VTSRFDRDDLPVLPEEDDWFATPFQESSSPETDEVAWQDDEPAPPPRPAPDGLAQRQIVIVLAVVAIIVVIGVGILLVRAIGGSDNSTTPTTPVTTPTATTPTTTTGTSTTPTGTTGTTTTPTTTTPTTTTPTTSGVTSVPTDATLRAGSSGTSVTSLQKALNQLGYSSGTADGTYGPATTQAVTAFQAAKGLPQDGVAGPTTLTAINTALAAG